MFLGTVYLEVDHEDWKIPNLENLLTLTQSFHKLGMICSKATLKFIYHLLCREQPEEALFNIFLELLSEHYFYGGYDYNSDLEIVHSHESHKEVLASKILQKFQQLVLCQLIENKELGKFL
jgi:hypothetical protein